MANFVMSGNLHYWILVAFPLICIVASHPIISPGEREDSSVVSIDPTTFNDCTSHLKGNIETCLTPFEQKLIVYQAVDTSDMERKTLIVALCHEYVRTLQCLHLLFQECQPNSEHLNLMAHRVGYLKDYMDKKCILMPEDMTPAPTRAPREEPTTLPSTTRTVPPSTDREASTTNPIKASAKTEITTHPTRHTTTFNMAYFSTKLNKLLWDERKTHETSTKYDTDSVAIIDTDKKIPLVVLNHEKHNSAKISKNDIVDTSMIQVSSRVDCNTANGELVKRCATMFTNSASTPATNPAFLLITTLLGLTCIQLHF